MADLTDRPFTNCVVIAVAEPHVTYYASGKQRNRARSLVRCDCGNEFVVLNDCLISGQTTECKACSNERKFRKHGHAGKDHTTRSRTYRAWLNMKKRCY